MENDVQQLKNYNSLKQVVDNCSFLIEIGEDGLIKEKLVDLERLNHILIEAKASMKIHYYLHKRLKYGSISKKIFLEGMEQFESELKVFTKQNEHKMQKILFYLSMANPRRIALESDVNENPNDEKINKIWSLLTGLTLAVNDIKKFHKIPLDAETQAIKDKAKR